MELDPSKISLWKEYFCRFDEGKREFMLQQVSAAEQKDKKLKNVKIVENQLDGDIQSLMNLLKSNQKRIEEIRNIGKETRTVKPPSNAKENTSYAEVAINDSIVLTADDLEVI
jgi:1,6-anhydro-N-acetylmuramate kinase